jgi:hypothetical protein
MLRAGPRPVACSTAAALLAFVTLTLLAGCDRKPSSPPTPSAAVSAATGHTAASGNAPAARTRANSPS